MALASRVREPFPVAMAATLVHRASTSLDPQEEHDFRARCRGFLAEHAVGGEPTHDEDPRGERALTLARRFQSELAAASLAGLTQPRELGGQGLSVDHERIWREEAGRYPLMTEQLAVSLGNCLPVLERFGTPAQKDRHLARMISAEELFCQLFSEPEAGSDLAAVRTRAVRDGDEWVVNGQKVWTTLAHLADFGILLARTDPSVAKHRGLSMFVVDMRAPGIETRPIHQIDGGMHFDEVFLSDVRLPADALIGGENDGWSVATAMLMFQRISRGTGQTGGVKHPRSDRVIDEARARGVTTDPLIRVELARLYSFEVCQAVVAQRARADIEAGRPPGPAGSLAKLANALIANRYRDLLLRIAGADAQAWAKGGEGGRVASEAVNTLQFGIAGGTSEIQRNIIGERVLGLPREPAIGGDSAFERP